MKPSFLIASAVCVLAMAGCGGSSKSSTTGSTATSTGSAPAASTSTAASSSGGASSAITAQAVAACKQQVDATASVPADLKAQLRHICDEAGAGNQAGVKKATHDVCIAIIKEKIPASEQTAAEANCPAA